MHLIERYAAAGRVKISKPEIQESFYPIAFEKYIVLNAGGAMPAKLFSYYAEVLELLFPIFDKHNIKVIQIGGKDEEQFPNVLRLNGLTTYQQSAYIVNRALLVLGNDSFTLHLASIYNKKIVGLFSVSPPQICGPYQFQENTNYICLEPEFDNRTYAFNPQEAPPPVNLIKIESVVKAVIDLLGLTQETIRQTIFIGKDYKKTLIEIVPDHILDPRNFQGAVLHVRNDLFVNPEGVFGNLFHKKCLVVTDTPLDINILKNLKHNLINVLYLLEIQNKERDLLYIKQLHESGLPYVLLTSDKENLVHFKFDYLDYNPVILFPINKKEDIKQHEMINDNTYFKTNKFLLSNGKIFLSRGHWRMGIEYNQNEKSKVIDHEEFYYDLDYIYCFNCNEKSVSNL